MSATRSFRYIPMLFLIFPQFLIASAMAVMIPWPIQSVQEHLCWTLEVKTAFPVVRTPGTSQRVRKEFSQRWANTLSWPDSWHSLSWGRPGIKLTRALLPQRFPRARHLEKTGRLPWTILPSKATQHRKLSRAMALLGSFWLPPCVDLTERLDQNRRRLKQMRRSTMLISKAMNEMSCKVMRNPSWVRRHQLAKGESHKGDLRQQMRVESSSCTLQLLVAETSSRRSLLPWVVGPTEQDKMSKKLRRNTLPAFLGTHRHSRMVLLHLELLAHQQQPACAPSPKHYRRKKHSQRGQVAGSYAVLVSSGRP